MFEFDVKQIFKERIYEIIFLLCSMHLGTVMVSFILKWAHPYLKRVSVMHNNHEKVYSDNTSLNSEQLKGLFNNQRSREENKVAHKSCYENKTTMSEEYESIINYLESCVDISRIPQEILKKQYNKTNVLNELSLQIESAINIRNLIKDNLKRRKSTSEAQTNITINPIMKTDCSSPKFILSCESKSYDIPLHISKSSDSFVTVKSNHSESEVCELMPNNHTVCIYDKVTSQDKCRKACKTGAALLNINSLPSKNKVFKAHVESLQVENSYDYEKQVSQENKILEMAINEFENELKPIKDQIKVLKECLHNFDCCETDDSFASDLSSSVSDPITISECYSEEMSTMYNSDLKSFSSKRYKMIDKKCPLNARLQRNSRKQIFEENTPFLSKCNSKNNTLTSYKLLHPVEKYTNRRSKEICILEVSQSSNDKPSFNKRSPIADMYIKLSNCSSQTANFVKNSSYSHTKPDKSVTCHINLNFSLGTVTLSSTNIKNWIKEREMEPVLSEPEDVLNQLSHL